MGKKSQKSSGEKKTGEGQQRPSQQQQAESSQPRAQQPQQGALGGQQQPVRAQQPQQGAWGGQQQPSRAQQSQQGARGPGGGVTGQVRGQQFPEQLGRDFRSQGSQSQEWRGDNRRANDGSSGGARSDRGGDRRSDEGSTGSWRGHGQDFGRGSRGRGSGGYRGQDRDFRGEGRRSDGGFERGGRGSGGGSRGRGDFREGDRRSDEGFSGGSRGQGFRGGRGYGDRGQGGQFRGGRGGFGQRPDYRHQEDFPPSTVTVEPQSVAEITQIMSTLALIPKDKPHVGEPIMSEGKEWIIPQRSSKGSTVGTRGREIQIEVNHLKLTLTNTKTALHYDVTLNPDKISKRLARKVLEEVRRKCYGDRYPAFDGKKNLYASGQKGKLFDGKELNISIDLPRDQPKKGNETLTVKVTIKPAEKNFEVDLTMINKFLASRDSRELVAIPQEAITALDIALRNPSCLNLVQVGRNFFTPPTPGMEVPLGNGMDLWFGFYQSAVLGWAPSLNVDVAHKGFPQAKDVLSVMVEIGRKRGLEQLQKEGLRPYEAADFEKFIKGLRINYEMPGTNEHRSYRVLGITKSAQDTKFKLENGSSISVQEYFRKEKRAPLRYPNLPCLHVGNPEKTNYIPPEFCKILPNQIVMKKLDPTQTRALIKEAAKRPDERKKRILDTMVQVGFNEDKCIKEFGVSVGNEFLRVPARILDAPKVEYKDKQVPVRNGVWDPQHFLSAKALTKWAVVSVFCNNLREEDLWNLTDNLMGAGKQVGMEIAKPLSYDMLEDPRRPAEVWNLLLNHFKQYPRDLQLVVVVFPERQSDIYGKVKFITENVVGRLTQCIKDKTISRNDFSTAKNILLKINTKLNGTNHTIVGDACRKSVRDVLKGAMVMGADVTHPPPEQKTTPSVAAVTASHDPLAFRYNMCCRLQPPKQEIILDMRNVVRHHLLVYMAHNKGTPPQKIIFYRDGVSEGQFMQVLGSEMWAIHAACRDILQRVLPVTFMVVQKRHHTRFFPMRQADMDKKCNPLAGTVVDTHITHPREMDFYLVSHASIQGTSRPTKYHRLYDDNNIGEDDLEELTFYLCHMFSRCTRSVSYPAPTYYAHLAAARGRVHLDASRGSVDLEKLDEEMEKRTIKPAVMDGFPMFFT